MIVDAARLKGKGNENAMGSPQSTLGRLAGHLTDDPTLQSRTIDVGHLSGPMGFCMNKSHPTDPYVKEGPGA